MTLAREVLLDQAAGQCLLSTPASMALDARRLGGPELKFKAASVARLSATGVRLIARATAKSAASQYCAVFGHEGAGDQAGLCGLVSEVWLSRMRTAAFGTVIVERLVNPGPLVVALCGAGAIAAEIVPMLAHSLPIKELRVHTRRTESMSAFVAAHAKAVPFTVRAEADCARAAQGADLVITLTRALEPFIFPGMLKPGAVVCSMGNDNEIDHGVLGEAKRLIVDDADFAAEAGDGAAWIAQGRMTRGEFEARIDALACDVVAGGKPGRLAESDRIIALAQGMASGDIAFAAHVLRQAKKSGRGRSIELPPAGSALQNVRIPESGPHDTEP